MITKKTRKKPETTSSQIRSVLRQLWLRSRERAATLKRDEYTCQKCHCKQSKAKGKEFSVCVHHINGIQWDNIIKYIREELLQSPNDLITLCDKCHDNVDNDKGIILN